MMARALVAAVGTGLALAVPVSAQDHGMGGMAMPGMTMPPPARKPPPRKGPAPRKPPPAKPKPAPTAKADRPEEMPGMAMPGQGAPRSAMPADHGAHDDMAGMDMAAPGAASSMAAPAGSAGTDLPAGNAPPPPPPGDHYADRQFPPATMARVRARMMRQEGGQAFYRVLFNLAELQIRDGRDGYRWGGEAWYGGDINRLAIKTEGAGTLSEGVESAEIQALYSRAVGPYVDLQAGIRQDVRPLPARSYATIGVEGLAPYMIEFGGAAFLSDKGDLLGRLEGWYDQRITQRLILQPRVELNLAAQDVPENRLGAGVSNVELGLRLRYALAREFAPYIGLSHEAKTGRTARLARAEGKDPTSTSFVAGLRFWF